MKIGHHPAALSQRHPHPRQHLAPQRRLGVEKESEGRDEIEWPWRQGRISRDVPLN